MSNQKSSNTENFPKVSIVGTTYNHEKYIREALDSFVMQQTDFSFEIIIADDFSNDKTPEIIKEFSKLHPEIFRPILRKNNKGVVANFIDALRTAKGRYIALCEGDDYWTDPQKLQTQTDFLDNNPEHSLCFHPVKVVYENDIANDSIYPETKDRSKFTVAELLKRNFIQTNSVMYRARSYENLPSDVLPLDWYLHLYHAQFGKIGFIDKIMAVYRRHPGGLWWESDNKNKIWQKYGLDHLNLYKEIHNLYKNNTELEDALDQSLNSLFSTLLDLSSENRQKLLHVAVEEFPENTANFMVRQQQKINIQNQNLSRKSEELKKRIELHDQLSNELNSILNSRSWTMAQRLSKMHKLLKREG